MSTKAKPKAKALKRYVIDWQLGGALIVEASSPEEAQEKFDKATEGGPGKFSAMRDGEWSNDAPQELKDE